MMKILKIYKNNKYVNLKLSNNQTISLYLETMIDLNLREGMDVDLEIIKNKNNYYRCLFYAINLLKRQNYSLKKLYEKLLLKFKKSTINLVLITLKEEHIINDDNSIVNLINILIDKGYGPNKISGILIQKGYNIKDVNFNQFDYKIDRCISKFYNTHKDLEKSKLQQKLFSYLYNKGYSRSFIYSYIRKENGNYDK